MGDKSAFVGGMRVKLKDITKFSKGTQINGKNLIDDGAYSYLNGGINPSGKWNEFNVAENTVTISEGGNSSGYVNYMNEAFWCGAHCYYLYDGPKNSKYLYYALKSQQERLFRIRSGACMPNIKKSDLGNFIIEYEEDETRQEEVVKVLEKCELLIEDYNKKLALLDEAVRARFVEMFGDPVINDKKWLTVSVENLCDEIYGGGTPSKAHKEYYENGDIPWVSSKDMKTDVLTDSQIKINQLGIENSTARLVPVNSVIMVIRSGILKHTLPVAINAVPITVNQDLKVFIPGNKITPRFLAMQFKMHEKSILFGVRAVTADNIEFNSLKARKMIVPPLELQNQFASFLEEIDKSRSRIQKSLEASQELFDSLMQEYFG